MLRVAFLRAVNLPNHGNVPMSSLRALFDGLGFADARTLLQTGNVVFDAGSKAGTELESLLESEAAKRLGLKTDFFVRDASQIADIVSANPFPAEAKADPGHLVVLFARETPSAQAVDRLRAAMKGREVVAAGRRDLYAVYPDGIGRSKLTAALIESKLGTRVTGRNWNTVLKLRDLMS